MELGPTFGLSVPLNPQFLTLVLVIPSAITVILTSPYSRGKERRRTIAVECLKDSWLPKLFHFEMPIDVLLGRVVSGVRNGLSECFFSYKCLWCVSHILERSEKSEFENDADEAAALTYLSVLFLALCKYLACFLM